MDKIIIAVLIICLIPCITVAMAGGTDMPKVNIGTTLLNGLDGFPTVDLSALQSWFDAAKKEPAMDVPVLGDILNVFINLVRLAVSVPVLIWNGINFLAWVVGLSFTV